MTNERLNTLGTVAQTLGANYMLDLISGEEKRQLMYLTAEYFVNTNIYEQARAQEIIQRQQELFNAFGSHRLIKEIYDLTYQIILLK